MGKNRREAPKFLGIVLVFFWVKIGREAAEVFFGYFFWVFFETSNQMIFAGDLFDVIHTPQ